MLKLKVSKELLEAEEVVSILWHQYLVKAMGALAKKIDKEMVKMNWE